MEHLKVYVSHINIPKVCRPVVLAFTASLSASTEVVEELLSYFADIGNKECFSALLRPELSWQHGLNDFYMPYKVQLAQLEKEVKEWSKKDKRKMCKRSRQRLQS
ncbi:hypothetical protein C8R43DRAFT_1045156 [Mycena crocata]|nr:hypothetical protein C8R43DRAFT_1045156 [Mycena crocata]